MLKCKQVAEQASDYLEGGELSGWQKFQWRLHLAMCTHCRRFLRHLKLTKTMAAELSADRASDSEVKAVLEKLKNRSQ